MAKTRQKNSGDFEAILAGLAEQAAQASPGEARRPKPAARREERNPTPATEVRVRRLFKNISIPWPGNFSGLVKSLAWRPQHAYDEIAAEAEQPPQAAAAESDAPQVTKTGVPKPAKTEDEGIAAELGLRPELGLTELKRIRRDFAKKNHPDRFGPPNRRNAERRMSIANMLIDELMRQSRQPR